MKSRDSILIALAAGAAVGALILGLVGRAATAGLALARGAPTNLSLAGVAQVIVYGAVLGALGSLAALPTRAHFPESHCARSALVAAVLFVGSLLFPLVRGRIRLGAGEAQLLTLVVAAAIFFVYALMLDSLLDRLERGPRGDA